MNTLNELINFRTSDNPVIWLGGYAIIGIVVLSAVTLGYQFVDNMFSMATQVGTMTH